MSRLLTLVAFQYFILNIAADGVPSYDFDEPLTGFLGAKRAPSSNTASIPIRRDDIGDWYGLNLTVGANHNQKLYLEPLVPYTSLNPHQYSPSSESVITRKSHVEMFHGVRGLQSQTITTYSDVFGVPPLLVRDAKIDVITKTVPPRFNTKGYYGDLPLSFRGSWFRSLCKLGMIAECRYGLAMGTGHMGQLVLGHADESLFEGELARTHLDSIDFIAYGDVVVNNETILKHVRISMEPSFTDITGPYDDVQKIFRQLGITKDHRDSTHEFLYGSFPCDNPPSIGFRFPSGSGKIFYVSGSAMTSSINLLAPNGCQATLYGDRGYDKGILANSWSLGSNFFRGHYVDFDISSSSIGIADLRNPEDGSSSPIPNKSKSGPSSGSSRGSSSGPSSGSSSGSSSGPSSDPRSGSTSGSGGGSPNHSQNQASGGRLMTCSSATLKGAAVALALGLFHVLSNF